MSLVKLDIKNIIQPDSTKASLEMIYSLFIDTYTGENIR